MRAARRARCAGGLRQPAALDSARLVERLPGPLSLLRQRLLTVLFLLLAALLLLRYTGYAILTTLPWPRYSSSATIATIHWLQLRG